MKDTSRLILPEQRLLRPTRRRLLGGLGATALVAAAPATALANGIGVIRFRPPPVGSKWTYEYADGRVETFERLEDGAWLTWTVVRCRREIDDEDPQIRSYNILNGNWMVTFDEKRQPLFAADPDDRRYRWPISVGGFWRSQYIYRDYRREESYEAYAAWSVKSFELVKFMNRPWRTFCLVSDRNGRQTMLWFAWDLGLKLRETIYEDGELVRDKRLVSFERGDGTAPEEPDPDAAG